MCACSVWSKSLSKIRVQLLKKKIDLHCKAIHSYVRTEYDIRKFELGLANLLISHIDIDDTQWLGQSKQPE